MEHAIIINRIQDLENIEPKYQRVYFGNEFCPKLLPAPKEWEKALKITKKMGREFTLVTPYADSEGLRKIKKIINYLAERLALEEAVVNDWGVLHYIRKEFPFCPVIVGRGLARVFWGEAASFMKMKVKRLETDFLIKGLEDIDKDEPIKISFYYPYTVIQGTRYCPLANMANNKRPNRGIISCFKECLKIGDLEVENSLFSPKIILRGNAQFVKCSDIRRALTIRNIDRLVFQPRPPV